MALIKEFVQKTRDRLAIHPTEVSAHIYVQEVDGRKLVQIDTHGAADRQIPGKVSQTLQLDEPAAKELLTILMRHFD